MTFLKGPMKKICLRDRVNGQVRWERVQDIVYKFGCISSLEAWGSL